MGWLILLAPLPFPSDLPRPPKSELRVDAHGHPLPRGVLTRVGRGRVEYPSSSYPRPVVSPDGKRIAVAVGDSEVWHTTIQVWDLASGEKLRSWHIPAWLGSLAFADDNKVLVTGSREAGLFTFDVASGQQLARFGDPTASAWAVTLCPDGKTVVAQQGDHLGFWDRTTGKETRRLDLEKSERDGGAVTTIVFSTDGKTMATACRNGPEVVVRDYASGKVVHRLRPPRMAYRVGVWSLALSPDGKTAATVALGGVFNLWDLATGNKRVEATIGALKATFESDGNVTLIDRRRNIRRWDATTGKELPDDARRLDAWLPELVSLPNGKILAVEAAAGIVRAWDVASGKELLGQYGHADGVGQVAFSPDGKTLYTCSERCAHVWDTVTGKHRQAIADGGWLLVPPCGRVLRAAAPHGEAPYVCDLLSGQSVKPLRGKSVLSCALSPDGTFVATGSEDGAVTLMELGTGKVLHEFKRARKNRHMVFSPNGQLLAAHDHWGTSIRIWDLETRKSVFDLSVNVTWVDDHPQARELLAFSPDGKWFAAHFRGYGLVLHQVTGARRAFHLQTAATALAYSPDGATLALGDKDGTVFLWEVATHRELLRRREHRGEITSLAFSADGQFLASGSMDGTALIWDLRHTADARPTPGDVAADLAQLWEDAAARDPRRATRALWALAAMPEKAVPFLADQLVPAVPLTCVRELIADLGNADFLVRQAATRELEDMGPAAIPALRAAIAKDPLVEVQQRLKSILRFVEHQHLSAAQVRQGRAVRLLALIDSASARKTLQTLAAGPAAEFLTQAARVALANRRSRSLHLPWIAEVASP